VTAQVGSLTSLSHTEFLSFVLLGLYMHSFTSLLVLWAGLVTAQDHLAVLGADGVSVGYHADAPKIVSSPVDPEKTTSGVSHTSQTLPLQPPFEVHTPFPVPVEKVVVQPVEASAPTGSPSIGQLGAVPSASGTAPRGDGRCGAKFNNALCDPNGMYGGCCS
jgi:hypothetical protein